MSTPVDRSAEHPMTRVAREVGDALRSNGARMLERRRIAFYAKALRTHGLSPEFILDALSDPAWPMDSRDGDRQVRLR